MMQLQNGLSFADPIPISPATSSVARFLAPAFSAASQKLHRRRRRLLVGSHNRWPTASRLLCSGNLQGHYRKLTIRRGGVVLSQSSAIGSAENQPMAAKEEKDSRIAKIAASIRVIPDFPKPGIIFQDITTLLLDVTAFRDTIDLFVERYSGKDISVVAGIEARGFIFGPPIALAIGAKFVPMRKPKKLPGAVISEEYALEYGTDIMEMHVGAVQAGERVLVIDDLIATGGTLCAAVKLLERVGAQVVECACLIELPELKGRERLAERPLFVLVSAT